MDLTRLHRTSADRIAYAMAGTDASLTYAQLDEQSNQLSHALRAAGLNPGDTLVLLTENRLEWPIAVAAGMRSGYYVTPVNSHLLPGDLLPVLSDALTATNRSAIVVSNACQAALASVLAQLSAHRRPFIISLDSTGPAAELADAVTLADAVHGRPTTPIDDELLGARVLYSGGSTGRPRAHRHSLPGIAPADAPTRHAGLGQKLRVGPDITFLTSAPSYHAAPFTFQLMVLAEGGTVVCSTKFDPEQTLAHIERHRVTHAQFVPTMLRRLVKLPRDVREVHDLSSVEVVITSGAPCPADLKTEFMQWWGPVLHEYYGASEGYGHTWVGPQDALARPGTVGRPLTGNLRITDGLGRSVEPGASGTVWFENTGVAEDSPERWRTMGDLGHLDGDGFLWLDGRSGATIISGGVNISPDEVEEALLSHPAVADVAVVGTPDDDLGEHVTAIVELGAPASEQDLIEHCRSRIAHFKAPREIVIVASLPRQATGKLNRRTLRDQLVNGNLPTLTHQAEEVTS